MLQVLASQRDGAEADRLLERHERAAPPRSRRRGRGVRRPGALPRRARGQRSQHARRIEPRRDPVLHSLRRVPERCPVYQQIGGHAYGSIYPGPVGAVLMPALQGLHQWRDLPQASSLCGACREVCPVRIDIPRMLLEHRDKATQLGLTPIWVTFGLTVFRQIATRPALFRRAQALASWATRRLATDGWISGCRVTWHAGRRSVISPRLHRRRSRSSGRRASDERQPRQRAGRCCPWRARWHAAAGRSPRASWRAAAT